MNSISIVGRVGRDAEIRYLPNGDAVLGFSVADDQGKDKPAIWWNCSLFGKRAESLSKYITKGAKVAVSGNVTERAFTDKQGAERKVLSVRVNDIDPFCGSNSDKVDGANQRKEQRQPIPKTVPGTGFDDFADDIPF